MTASPVNAASSPLSPNGVQTATFTTSISLFESDSKLRLVSPRTAPWGTVIHSFGSDSSVTTNAVLAWSDDSKVLAVWRHSVPIYACELHGGVGAVRDLEVRLCGYRLPMPGSNSNKQVIAHLLSKGFSVQEFFCQAANEGETSSLKILRQFGGDLDKIDNAGYSPLWLAVMHTHDSTAAALLDMGANPNPRSARTGLTPLMIAAVSGKENLVRLLLAHGADKRIVDNQGKTAAGLARMANKESMAQLIEGY